MGPLGGDPLGSSRTSLSDATSCSLGSPHPPAPSLACRRRMRGWVWGAVMGLGLKGAKWIILSQILSFLLNAYFKE